jgi:hypothetical protein
MIPAPMGRCRDTCRCGRYELAAAERDDRAYCDCGDKESAKGNDGLGVIDRPSRHADRQPPEGIERSCSAEERGCPELGRESKLPVARAERDCTRAIRTGYPSEPARCHRRRLRSSRNTRGPRPPGSGGEQSYRPDVKCEPGPFSGARKTAENRLSRRSCLTGTGTLRRPGFTAGGQTQAPAEMWHRRIPCQTRPGSRLVTSWTSHASPSGSLKAQNDP